MGKWEFSFAYTKFEIFLLHPWGDSQMQQKLQGLTLGRQRQTQPPDKYLKVKSIFTTIASFGCPTFLTLIFEENNWEKNESKKSLKYFKQKRRMEVSGGPSNKQQEMQPSEERVHRNFRLNQHCPLCLRNYKSRFTLSRKCLPVQTTERTESIKGGIFTSEVTADVPGQGEKNITLETHVPFDEFLFEEGGGWLRQWFFSA